MCACVYVCVRVCVCVCLCRYVQLSEMYHAILWLVFGWYAYALKRARRTVAHSSGRQFIGHSIAKYFIEGGWTEGTVLSVVAAPGGGNMYKVEFPPSYTDTMTSEEVGQAIEVWKSLQLLPAHARVHTSVSSPIGFYICILMFISFLQMLFMQSLILFHLCVL